MTFVLIGVGLIVLLAADVFSTVFHSRGRGGPLTRRLNSVIWALYRSLGRRRDGTVREKLLATAGPVLVVTTLVVWVTIFVFSFALVYYPSIHEFLVSPGALRDPWLEAVYYSGYTAATLGVGDIVPDAPSLRLLAPLQAFGGFALLSAAVTYFLAIYREVLRMQALSSDLAAYFSRGTSEIVEFVRGRSAEPVARWSEQISSSISEVLLGHFEYPILHYFRPARTDKALPVQLARLFELDAAVRAEDEDTGMNDLRSHPSYLALRHSVDSYVREVHELFLPPRWQRRSGGEAESAADLHPVLLEYMLYDSP